MLQKKDEPEKKGEYSLIILFIESVRASLSSFGGGIAYMPLMQRELVNNRCWLTMEDFLDSVSIARVSPGAIALNAAIGVGYKLGGLAGALAALLGVLVPTLLLVLLVAIFFIKHLADPLVQKFYSGMRPAVVGLVMALWTEMATVVLNRSLFSWALFLGSFLGLFILKIPPLVIILGAGLGGYLFKKAGELRNKNSQQ